MNLPQNIHKSDGAIAKSFSQELGLNLDLKTRTQALYAIPEYISDIILEIEAGKYFLTANYTKLALWCIKDMRIIRCFDEFNFNIRSMFKLNEHQLLIVGGFEKTLGEDPWVYNFKIEKYDVPNEFIDVGIFDINTGVFTSKIKTQLTKHRVDYCNEKKLLLIEYDEDCFHLYDTRTFELLKSFNAPNKRNMDYGISKQANFLWLNSIDNKQINIYNTHNFNLEYKIDKEDIKEIYGINAISQNEVITYIQFNGVFQFNMRTKKYTTLFSKKNNDRLKFDNKLILAKKYNYDLNKTQIRIYNASTFNLISETTLEYYTKNEYWSGETFIALIEPYENKYRDKHPVGVVTIDKTLTKISSTRFSNEYTKVLEYNKKHKYLIFPTYTLALKDAKNIYNKLYDENEYNDGEWETEDYYISAKKQKRITEFVFQEICTQKTYKFIVPTQKKGISQIFIEKIPNSDCWYLQWDSLNLIINIKENKVLSEIESKQKISFALTEKIGFRYVKDKETGSEHLFSVNIYNGRVKNYHKFKNKSGSWFMSERRVYICEKNKRVLTIASQIIKKINKRGTVIDFFDYKLNILKTLELEITIDNKSWPWTEISKNKKKLFLLSSDEELYCINTGNYTVTKLFKFKKKLGLSKNTPLVSDSGNYCAYGDKDGIHIFDVVIGSKIGFIKNNRINYFGNKCFFDEESNLMITQGNYYTNFFRLKPFAYLGNCYIERNGELHLQLLPDKTSPNGWFYTNTPDKINVLKTKADGSEPELLPVDDKERLAFISHHNRKDIVMQKLFEPEKYEEFIKLNARAEDLTKQDLAIELKHIEHKKLNDRN